jgi:hypothetical protein
MNLIFPLFYDVLYIVGGFDGSFEHKKRSFDLIQYNFIKLSPTVFQLCTLNALIVIKVVVFSLPHYVLQNLL